MNQNGRRRSSIEFDTFAGKKVCQVLFELVLMSFRGFLFQKSSIGMHFLYKFPGSNFYVVSGDFLRSQPSHEDFFFSQSSRIRSLIDFIAEKRLQRRRLHNLAVVRPVGSLQVTTPSRNGEFSQLHDISLSI